MPSGDAASTVGSSAWFRARRRDLGLTQRKLADRLSVSQQAVGRWETSGVPKRRLSEVIEVVEEITAEQSQEEEPFAQVIHLTGLPAAEAGALPADQRDQAVVQVIVEALAQMLADDSLPVAVRVQVANNLGSWTGLGDWNPIR